MKNLKKVILLLILGNYVILKMLRQIYIFLKINYIIFPT